MNPLLRAIQCVAMGLCLLGGWGCTRRAPQDSMVTDDKTAVANLASVAETTEQLTEPSAVVLNPSATAEDSTSSVPTAERRATLALDHATSSEASSGDAPAAWVPHGSWTTQRLIALAETGPIVIDLSVNVGNLSLREANDRLLARTTAELLAAAPTTHPVEKTSESPLAPSELSISWEQLLELPLVQSGWLGNLVASSEQTGQLIDQYDSDRDAKVSAQELHLFLSRGLERSAALQVADIGEAPDRRPYTSPWGSGDLNQDHVLDANERDQFAQTLRHRDLNADGLITLTEWSDSSDDASQMAMINGENRNSFLRNRTLLLRD
ncbi:MAG: hypothetical protein KDA51_15655, partial [Planctomycetales bacterium]|nr:hypothetical protein [Planctomycetales bacterium]